MSGYYRKPFCVPTEHSIAPISLTFEANIIESYFTNHPFFEAPCRLSDPVYLLSEITDKQGGITDKQG